MAITETRRSETDAGDPLDGVLATICTGADRQSEAFEAECRVPDDLYRVVARHGLFRQLVAVELGGLGDTPTTWFRRGVRLARQEPSLGWVVTQGASELGWIAAGGERSWSAEVLLDPEAASASTIAGFGRLQVHGTTATLAGDWSFDTGCQGATWIGGFAVVEGDPSLAGSMRMCWVPAERATIVEDWDSTGMRGTGSHRIVIPEQEIPLAWTVAVFEPTANEHGPHRCLVGNGNWPIASAVAATQLGTARRALDEARRLVVDKAPPPRFEKLAANAAVQRRLTQLEGAWMAAYASVAHELDGMWAQACEHHELSDDRRWRLATANANANAASVAVVDGACEVTGTAVAARTGRLSRCLRDVQTLRGHIAVSGPALEGAALTSLGLEPADVLV